MNDLLRSIHVRLAAVCKTARSRQVNSRPAFPFTVTLLLCTFAGAGCDSKTPAKPAAATARPAVAATATANDPSSPQVQVGAEPLTAVDTQDDPEAPRALPRTGTIPRWTKSRAVHVMKPDAALAAIKDEPLRAALQYFKLQRVATCAYTLGSVTADVLYVEAPSFDCLSLFTTLATDPRPILHPDGSVRGQRASGPNIYIAWQGGVYLQISVTGVIDQPPPGVIEQLIDRIVFTLPSADAPVLMRIVPKDKRDRCRVYFAHTADTLKLANLEALQNLPAEEVNRQLDLGRATTISVAAVEVIPTEPHLIWVAEYPTPADAVAAHAHCTAAIKAAASPLAKTTDVKTTGGPYLVGTWTKRQEALQPLLPLLLNALPELESPTSRPTSAPSPSP